MLNERLIDKLELVIEDLNAHGVRVEHLAVMSGFRTPQYNGRASVRAAARATAATSTATRRTSTSTTTEAAG